MGSEVDGDPKFHTRKMRQRLEDTLQHMRADIDVSQMVYEMYGLILALHHDARFLHIPGSVERAEASFRRLIDSYRPQGNNSAGNSPASPAKNSKSAARKAA